MALTVNIASVAMAYASVARKAHFDSTATTALDVDPHAIAACSQHGGLLDVAVGAFLHKGYRLRWLERSGCIGVTPQCCCLTSK